MQPTERTRVRRGEKRAVYDRDQIHQILDANLVCHVGFVTNGEPCVIPTAFLRQDDAIYLHGNRQNRMLNALLDGQAACISVLQLDGLVLARSGFHTSVNYRSVVVYGKASVVEDKVPVLNAFVDKLAPGRAADIRAHTPQELNATLVLRVPIEEASAKLRTGPPIDDEADYALDVWSGVLELATGVHAVPCPRLPEGVTMPAYVTAAPLWGRH